MIITGIDFDYRSVKIIQIKKEKQQFRLLKLCYSQVPQAKHNEEKDINVAQTILGLIKKNKIRIVNLHTCINRRFATVRWITLPSVDREEIGEMAKFQAAKILPYPLEEMVIDFQILTQQDTSTQIRLVVIHNDIINNHLKILKHINLEPKQILLTTDAIFNSYWHSHQGRDTFSTIIVDIGFPSTEINFIYQGRLVFSRSASITGLHLLKGLGEEIGVESIEEEVSKINLLETKYSSPHHWEKELVKEIRISLSAYKRECKEIEVQKIIISGEVSNLKGLDKVLEQDLGISVEVCDPLLKNFIISPHLRKIYDLKEKKPQLTTVVGLVTHDGKGINLLPEAMWLTQKQKEKKINFILTGLFILSLIFLLSIFAERKLYDTYQYLDYLNKEISLLLPLKKDLKLKEKRLNAIIEQMNKQTLCLDIIGEIYRLMPNDISLNELIYEENITLLRGEAKQMSTVFSLITILENSSYFKNVKITYATRRKVENQEIVDFQINCPLEKKERL